MNSRIKSPFETPDKDAKLYNTPINRQPITYGSNQALYVLDSDKTIAVWVISEFPSNPSYLTKWHQECADILKKILKLSVKKIMIDLSSNTGGNPCFATALADTLMKNGKVSKKATGSDYVKDAKLSPLFEKLTKAAEKKKATNFNPASYQKTNSHKTFNAQDLLKPRTVDGQKYTQLFTDVCEDYPDSPLTSIKHQYKPQDFVLITDSLCGSTCGRVAYKLSEVFEVKSVGIGSAYFRALASYPAAQVYHYSDLMNDISVLGLDNPSDKDIPQPLKISAQFSFAIRETYSLLSKVLIPLEFNTKKFSDIQLDLTDKTVMKPGAIWEYVAGKMKWVDQTIVDQIVDALPQ